MNFSIKAIYHWYRNSLRNPQYRGWVIAGTLAYLLSPFDIAPDLFPILGQIDDLALLTLLISELSQVLIDSYKQNQMSTQPERDASGHSDSDHSNSDHSETIDVDAVPLQD